MNYCSCIRGRNFNLAVRSLDCKTLDIEDISLWMDEEGYEVPENFEVTIKFPTLKKEGTVKLKGLGRTLVTSVELFGDKEPCCLPTDMICITVNSCDVTHEIKRAYLCDVQCVVDRLFADKGREDEAMEYLSMIRGIEASVEHGLFSTAQDTLTLLKRKLKNEKCGTC